MFKNVMLYKLSDLPVNLETCLQAAVFQPCEPSQSQSTGWVPPREAHGALVESVAGQRIIRLCIEKKSIPKEAMERALSERMDRIEKLDGRRPGRKEQSQIKEDIFLELLPQAFPRRSHVTAWIWTEMGLLVMDASNTLAADEMATQLVRAADVAVGLFMTKTSPGSYMAAALAGASTGLFDLGHELELASEDESKSKVRYDNLQLDRDDIRDHIQEGKMPTKMGMDYNDRASFVLNESGALKKVHFLETVFVGNTGEHESDFDADVTIATGELTHLLSDLIAELGGAQ
jgi:recombination associated protein RdgC